MILPKYHRCFTFIFYLNYLNNCLNSHFSLLSFIILSMYEEPFPFKNNVVHTLMNWLIFFPTFSFGLCRYDLTVTTIMLLFQRVKTFFPYKKLNAKKKNPPHIVWECLFFLVIFHFLSKTIFFCFPLSADKKDTIKSRKPGRADFGK